MSRLKNKGLSLLEVMLAVTILSLGLVMVVRSFVSSLHAIKTSQNLLVANLLLEEKIWEKEEEQVRSGVIIAADEQEEFDPPYKDFCYKISFAEEEGLALLYKSTFEVFWQQGKKEHSISCVTYLQGQEE